MILKYITTRSNSTQNAEYIVVYNLSQVELFPLNTEQVVVEDVGYLFIFICILFILLFIRLSIYLWAGNIMRYGVCDGQSKSYNKWENYAFIYLLLLLSTCERNMQLYW